MARPRRAEHHPHNVARLGIIAAMPQEFARIADLFERRGSEMIGPRHFLQCAQGETELVLVVSNIGKVAAATTATLLIDRFGVDAVVVTGVAGGVGSGVGIGDIVYASYLVQHDIDLKGVLGFQRFVIPSLGLDRIVTCQKLAELGRDAARAAIIDSQYRAALKEITRREPRMHVGVVGSGDRFIGDAGERTELLAQIPDLLAVEMEGAAIAQVCAEHEVPFIVARVISDTAQGDAPADFGAFIERVAAAASEVFVRELVSRL